MSDWQSMDSAPLDGTAILVWDGKDLSIVEFMERGDRSAFWLLGKGDAGPFGLAREATHWMLPPNPPMDKKV